MRLAAQQHDFAHCVIASTYAGVTTMHNVLNRFGFSATQRAGRLLRQSGAIRRIYPWPKSRTSVSKSLRWGLGLRELGLATALMGGIATANAQTPPPMPPPSTPAVAGPLVVN